MAYISSGAPGVFAQEIDLTTIVPGVSTTEGAMAGQFNWGPVDQVTLIDSEDEQAETFWKPDNNNYEDWFTAANFLAYANKLYIVRVVNETNANTALRATNAASGSTAILVKNDDHYTHNYADGSLKTSFNAGEWIARYAGDLGNSIKISVCPSAAAYSSVLSGTLSITANTNVVVGSGSSFGTQVTVGDIIVVNNESVKVAAVTSNTSLTLSTRHVSGASSASAVRYWEFFNEVNYAPGTSEFAAQRGGSNDEMHIVIYDAGGAITGQKNTVLEVYQQISKASDSRLPDGQGNFYKEVINQQSKWVRWGGHASTITSAGSKAGNTSFGVPVLPLNYTLANGRNGANIGNAERVKGYNFFRSTEEIDISFILGAAATQTIAVHIINNIAEVRKDCIAFFSPPKALVVNNADDEAADTVNYRNLLPSSSYAALDGNWKYQYDRYNDVYRFVPGNGDVAGAHVRTDVDRDPWYAAAGFNRGQIKNSIKLAWTPRRADQDVLYRNNINPIVTFPGEGAILFGQKTLLNKPSAFDRINVRRLFIVLRKAISKAARYTLFEFNDEFTRAQFRNMVEPFLRDVKGRRGIYDFLVVCDERNNTPEVIDRNEFVGDIYIKPAKAAEFIKLNFIAVRTGVQFEEVVGQAGT
jgi:hypothetical protein